MTSSVNGTSSTTHQQHHHDPDHRRPANLPTATSLDLRPEVNILKHAHQRTPNSLVIGTRASPLALTQAYLVQATLVSLFPEHANEFSIAPMSSAGDRNKIQPLYLMGGKALWTQELEVALVEGGIDLIVHSMKDVPTSLPDGCEIGAILAREEPRDCLVVKKGSPYKTLEDLPAGSVVGTSSVRRVAQLRRAFPKLLFADVVSSASTIYTVPFNLLNAKKLLKARQYRYTIKQSRRPRRTFHRNNPGRSWLDPFKPRAPHHLLHLGATNVICGRSGRTRYRNTLE